MKKVLSLLFVLVFALSFVACAGKTTGGDKPGDGKKSSGGGPTITADGVKFTYKPTGSAQKVFLSGSFNGWKPDDPQSAMEDLSGSGTFELVKKLDPGAYQYKFVVDGQWFADPANPNNAPDGFGGNNSVIEVK